MVTFDGVYIPIVKYWSNPVTTDMRVRISDQPYGQILATSYGRLASTRPSKNA
jgi:hypothetical protein